MKRSSDELLTFIFDHISKIASIHNHDLLLIELSKLGRDIVFAERCSIWILDYRLKKLWTKVAQGVAPIELEMHTGLVGSAVTENKSLIINDVQNDIRFNSHVDKKTGYITKTMIVLPMLNQKNRVIGAIQVINKKENEFFTEEDLKHLKLASLYVAESIETILLIEEIEKTQRELISIMGVTGENRSRETGFHVKRVAEYSWILARLYGLSEKECKILKDVSPMHDIGKIGIADKILNKPAKLNHDEMDIMKTHAQLGYDILKYSDLTLLKAASVVAYQHHEKYDGTGYPQGLKGKEIHIYGRITAIADVFDALGSERVYKKAWEDEKIFTLFKEEKGKQFDPELVDIFLENKEEFLTIRDKFKDV